MYGDIKRTPFLLHVCNDKKNVVKSQCHHKKHLLVIPRCLWPPRCIIVNTFRNAKA